ncbi:transposase [Klebsiella pneumoniae]|nr:transposase [Klebsiella pneumoniae]
MTVIRKASPIRQPDHETRRWWLRAELQRVHSGRCRAPDHRGGGVDQLRRGQSGAAGHAGSSSGQHRRNAGPDAGGCGFRSEAVLAKVADHHGDVIVALGREGREDAKVNAKTHPHTAAIAAKLKTEQGDAAYRRRKSIVRPEWLDQGGDGIASVQHEGLDKVQAEWKLVCMALNLRRMAYL